MTATAWRGLSAERKKLWEEWYAEFGHTRGRGRTDQGLGSGGDTQAPSPAPRRPREQFAEAGTAAKKQSLPRDDSRVRAQFDREAKPDPEPPKPGWKRRRSAAERKADGSYKP